MDEGAAAKWVKGTIRAEMALRNMTYADLVERLRPLGIEENERNLRNKIARGTFSAVFFVQCLEAIGASDLRLTMTEFLGYPARTPDRVDIAMTPIAPGDQASIDRIKDDLRRRVGDDDPEPPLGKS